MYRECSLTMAALAESAAGSGFGRDASRAMTSFVGCARLLDEEDGAEAAAVACDESARFVAAVVVVFDLNGARSTNVPFGWFLELELVRRITIRILNDRRRMRREVIVRIRLRSALLALALRLRGRVTKVERMLPEDVSI